MRRTTTMSVVALAAVAMLAGCGSSKKAADTTTTTPTSAAAATSAAGTDASPSAAAATCTKPADPTSAAAADAATTTGVTTAYTTFFDGKNTTATKVKYLQNATAMQPLLDKLQQTQGAAAAKLSAKVDAVALVSPGCAYATFDLLSDGASLAAGQHGLAVQEAGTWKVDDETICGLAALAGVTVTTCP